MRRPRTLGSVASVASVAIALLALLACGDDGVNGGDGNEDGYGPAERRDFVEACTATGVASTEACGCFYDRLAERVPHERFVELDERLRDDPTAIPDDVAELAIACGAEPDAAPPAG